MRKLHAGAASQGRLTSVNRLWRPHPLHASHTPTPPMCSTSRLMRQPLLFILPSPVRACPSVLLTLDRFAPVRFRFGVCVAVGVCRPKVSPEGVPLLGVPRRMVL